MPREADEEKVSLMVLSKTTVQQYLWSVPEHNNLALIKNNEKAPTTRKLAELLK